MPEDWPGQLRRRRLVADSGNDQGCHKVQGHSHGAVAASRRIHGFIRIKGICSACAEPIDLANLTLSARSDARGSLKGGTGVGEVQSTGKELNSDVVRILGNREAPRICRTRKHA
jgi:hypothetical protein